MRGRSTCIRPTALGRSCAVTTASTRVVSAAAAGTQYLLAVDGAEALPDPCSRYQPFGVRGVSQVVDPAAFAWSDDGWPGVALDELVVYELHVGTFSEEGTFDGVIPRFVRCASSASPRSS